MNGSNKNHRLREPRSLAAIKNLSLGRRSTIRTEIEGFHLLPFEQEWTPATALLRWNLLMPAPEELRATAAELRDMARQLRQKAKLPGPTIAERVRMVASADDYERRAAQAEFEANEHASRDHGARVS